MGIKRWAGGTADFLTFNKWDFDKRGKGEQPSGNNAVAETTGTTELKMERARDSSLKAHKSSMDPPPRVIKIRSNGSFLAQLLSHSIPLIISVSAPTP